MCFKFKVGDKVRVLDELPVNITLPEVVGKCGVVTRLGGCYDSSEGAVVYNPEFPSGSPEDYGEHGVWFPDKGLELLE